MHSNCGAYELLYWDIQGLKQIPTNIGSAQFRNENWATWTCPLGWPVEGIYPKNEGLEIGVVDRSHQKHPGDYHLIAVGDDYSKIRIMRYPSRNKGSEWVEGVGHSGVLTGVKWSFTDEWLYSIGGDDNCVFQWKKSIKK